MSGGDVAPRGADPGGVFARNLGVIRNRLPPLAELIEAAAIRDGEAAKEPSLAIVETPSGSPSARAASGAWLHSSRDPVSEARRLAASLDQAADAVLLLGFGLGYLAEACIEAGLDCVLVCEADPGLLAEALATRELGALLADERLGFVVGGNPDAVVSALELSGASRAAVLGLAAVESSAPAWYAATRDAAERWNAKNAVNEATLRRFGKLWVRNLAKNLDRIASCPGVDRLCGAMEGMPALVLAAGPSLDGILPHLPEIARRAVVVCVDTALRSVLRTGTVPDFLVVVDPQYWNWRHIAGLSAPSSLLVSESAAWPAVFRFRARRIFLAGSLFPLGRRIESFAGRKGSLGAGGSVATSAWDLARLMGCAPIWMAGLDLGYPEGATHARASFFEQRTHAESNRLAPASCAQAARLLGANAFPAPAAGGGSVLTDKRMRLYGWWFESRLARPGSPSTISLSPGGLALPGMGLGSIEELLALPLIRRRIEAALDMAASVEIPQAATEQASAGVTALLAELEGIARTAAGAAAAATRGREQLAAGRDCRSELALLDQADKRLLGNAAKDVAGFLLPPLGELLGDRSSDLGESLARSASLYQRVAESARYHVELLALPQKK